ncbi:MAG: YhdP family protein [Sulfitobacter sp.]
MTNSADHPPAKPRRRRLRRAGIWSLMITFVLVIAVAGAVIYLIGRPITAPAWLQARIETRIAQEMPQARVLFGEMVFIVDEGWRPRVRLRDVSVVTPTGTEIVGFNEFKASFSMRALLRGKTQPHDIAVSGVYARLRRGEDGRVSLITGNAEKAPVREAATLPQLIGQMDQVLDTPGLSRLVNIELRALTLRYEDQRSGRVWTVDGGRMVATRKGDALTLAADLAVLSGGAGVATLAANYTSDIGDTAAQFGVSFQDVAAGDIAAQGPAFAWLNVLRAPISGAVRSGLDEEGGFEPINATLQIGAGAVQPNDQTKPIPFDGARSYFSYDPSEQLLRFDTVSVNSQWVTGQASGTAILGGIGGGGQLTDLMGQFTLSDLRANPQNLYPDPVELAEADIDFKMKLDPFRIELGRLQISDQGKTLLINGGLQADPDGWRLSLDGRMDGLVPARLLKLWPARLKPKTRKWLAENLYEGVVSNVDLALRRSPDAPPQTYLAFDYEDAEVRFMRTMPNVTKGRGHLSLAENRLVVTVDEGQVIAPQGGAVQLAGSSFIMPDVRVKDGPPSVIRLETRSTLTAALSLLNQEPMRVMDKVKMPVTLADGQLALAGTLAVPLKKGGKPSEVKYHATGELLAITTDTLVKGRTLRAAKLQLAVDNNGLNISGKGRIDGVPFEGAWAQAIGPGIDKSALRGQVALNQGTLDAFNILLPPGTLSGEGIARIALDFQRGTAPKFALGSDLRGIGLSVPQLSWVKPKAASGTLQMTGSLGAVPQVDSLQIEGAGLVAKGSVRLKQGGTVDRVRFDQLRLGGWLDIPVDLVGQGKGKALQVEVRGGSIDLRRAEFGKSKQNGASGPPGPPMIVALDRLQITDTFALTGLKGRFATANGLDGGFQARLNGGTPIEGRVLPQAGRSAVRLASSDAGGVLRSADLLKQVVGGQMTLVLLPVGSGGAFDGRLTIGDVAIKDAPGIAALVNAVSVVGLVNELNGDGIYFDKVEADFRLTPNRLTLTRASAEGASLGLSMDGVYALDSGLIDMQGVISPVYLLNGIGAVFTRKGEGVFGFNYTLKGPAKSPSVGVNPLSALTPGGLREIFRAPKPELPAVDGVTGSTLPAPPAAPDKSVVPRGEDR